MKSASAGLISLLASGNEFLMADLYTFTLNDATVLRYTSKDGSLVVGGATFDGTTVMIERTGIRTITGIEVATLDLEVFALPAHTLYGNPWLQMVRTGALDGAAISVDRVFMPTWGDTSLGTVNLFTGAVADIDVGRTSAKLRCNSMMDLLNIMMPRNVYQAQCLHAVFDAGCGLNKSSFGAGVQVGYGGPNTAASFSHNSGASGGYFDLGVVTFTSGANNGISRTVKTYQGSSGLFILSNPLPYAPAGGDTFAAYPGCDNTQGTCSAKFSNLAHFRGYPFIPVPESTM